jgi:hypothetical protein
MAERADIDTVLDGTQFGTSLKDLSDGDLTRGHFDADCADGYSFSKNDGRRSAWEEGLETRDEFGFPTNADHGRLIDRPAVEAKHNVKRN